jgi:hypothetical protein
MNRNLFILILIIIFVAGYLMQQNSVNGYVFYVLVLGTVAVSIRRKYLKLKPWWAAPFRDIIKYFKLP